MAPVSTAVALARARGDDAATAVARARARGILDGPRGFAERRVLLRLLERELGDQRD